MSQTKMGIDSPALYPVLRGFDYVELFVGNVRQAAHYYRTIWGLEPVAFRGLETGSADRTSIAMRLGNTILLLTGAIQSSTLVAEHLRVHGEGVATVAFTVDDAETAFEAAVNRGAKSIRGPEVARDESGQIKHAEVKALDGFTHVFVDRAGYQGAFLPGFRRLSPDQGSGSAISELDHLAVAVQRGTLNSWVKFYEEVFGFEMVQREDVATEYSGMNSRVVQHASGACKFPLVEPAPGKRRSQVQEFLDFHNGPGVQHLAFSTSDIVATVRKLRNNGVEFLRIPDTYYDQLERRVGPVGDEMLTFRELGILVDHDEWGLLLQTFTRPCHDRPTLFFEVVERRGARGFGGGNIRALFEAVEREQALRSSK